MLRALAATAILATSAAAADLATIKARGTLRVLYAPGEPLFISPPPDPAPGFDHDVLSGFARGLGVRVEVVEVPTWDGLIPALLAGKGDLIAGSFTVTEARRQHIDFTAEVFPTRFVVVTRKPHRAIRTVEELRTERVGSHRGTVLVDVLRDAGVPPANVDDGVPLGGLVPALTRGRVTAVVLELHTALVAQRDDPAMQLGVYLGQPGSLAYGVRKADRELLDGLNRHIESARRTPAWYQLIVRYFGRAAPAIFEQARKESSR